MSQYSSIYCVQPGVLAQEIISRGVLVCVLLAILGVSAAMALKRARSDSFVSGSSVCNLLRHAESDARAGTLDERVQAGQKLKEFLTGAFVSGAIGSASTLAIIC